MTALLTPRAAYPWITRVIRVSQLDDQGKLQTIKVSYPNDQGKLPESL